MSVKHRAQVKKNPLQRTFMDISISPGFYSVSPSHSSPHPDPVLPSPLPILTPSALLRKHSKSSKEGKSWCVNKKTSYEEEETWNHLVRNKKKFFSFENGMDHSVPASRMTSMFRWGSENILYELLFQEKYSFLFFLIKYECKALVTHSCL